MKKRNKNKGITLIALVLILAGITIGQLTKNGLFDKVKLAKDEYENAQEKENGTFTNYEDVINGVIGSRETVTIPKDEYEELKNKGEYELIGEGQISSTSDNIVLNKSIENYRYLLLTSHLNSKENNDLVDNTIIPVQLNFYTTIILEDTVKRRVNTVYLSTNTILSVHTDQTTSSNWASTYILIYGIK